MLFHSSCICSLCEASTSVACFARRPGGCQKGKGGRRSDLSQKCRSLDLSRWVFHDLVASPETGRMTGRFPRNIMNKKNDDLPWFALGYRWYTTCTGIYLGCVTQWSPIRQGFSKGSNGSRAAVGAGHTPSRGRTRDKKWDSYRVKKKLKTCAFSYYLMPILILWKNYETETRNPWRTM